MSQDRAIITLQSGQQSKTLSQKITNENKKVWKHCHGQITQVGSVLELTPREANIQLIVSFAMLTFSKSG